MKGIILAGGLGTRLLPLTKITNKHLLPVYDKPMIYYPLQTLVEAGIEDIMIVTGGNHAGDFLRLLGNGDKFGLKGINYAYQEKEGGIAEALSLAEHFADGDKIVVILGDNLIEKSIKNEVMDSFPRVKNVTGKHIVTSIGEKRKVWGYELQLDIKIDSTIAVFTPWLTKSFLKDTETDDIARFLSHLVIQKIKSKFKI